MSLEKAKELRGDADYAYKKAHKIKAEVDESDRDWTDEDQEKFDRWTKEAMDALQRAEEIEDREDRLSELNDKLEEREDPIVGDRALGNFDDDDFGAGGREELKETLDEERGAYDEAFVRYLRFGFSDALPREDRKVLRRGPPVPDPDTRDGIRYIEERAGVQSVGTSGQGGVLVPEDFRRQLVEEQKAFGGMRRTRATIFETDSGADMPVPTMADTANTGSFVNEGSTISGTTGIGFANVTLKAHVVQSGPIKASIELLQDSAFDIPSLVRRAAGTRIGRVVEDKFFSSTSSTGTPLGLKTVSTGAVAVNGSTNLTRDDLLTLKHAVNPAYRASAEWMFSDDTLLQMARVVDGQGRPLLDLGVENRAVSRLLGHPWVVNQEVDDFGSTGNFPIWFGDFSHYFIRDVRAVELVRFNERFMQNRQVGWLLFQRLDGKPVSPTTDATLEPIRPIIHGS